MKSVAIIGNGYVGAVVKRFVEDHYKVYCYDADWTRCEYPHDRILNQDLLLQFGVVSNCPIETDKQVKAFEFEKKKYLRMVRERINRECTAAFVCVPTPPANEGSCDTTLVAASIVWLATPLIIIKSTVEPGTCERLSHIYGHMGKKIVFSPEFAGESKYWSPFKFDQDMKELPYYIFGGKKVYCQEAVELYKVIVGPMKNYLITDYTTSEMVKYVTNTFYAMKVTFCNEMYDVCGKLGVSYDEVRELWQQDPRVSRMHTAVFRDNRGFGGKCFPKDLEALVRMCEKRQYSPTLLKAVQLTNEKMREYNEQKQPKSNSSEEDSLP